MVTTFPTFLAEIEIWHYKLFQVWPRSAFSKNKVSFCKKLTILSISAVNKDIKSKINFADNDGLNILRLFKSLPNFFFTTSEMKRDF